MPKGIVSFEVSLYSILGTYVFDAFPQALNVWDDYVSHTGSSPGGGCDLTTAAGSAVALCCTTNLGAVVTISLSVAIDNSVLYFIDSPPRVLTPYQSFPEVLQLLIKKLQCSTDSFGPMG